MRTRRWCILLVYYGTSYVECLLYIQSSASKTRSTVCSRILRNFSVLLYYRQSSQNETKEENKYQLNALFCNGTRVGILLPQEG